MNSHEIDYKIHGNDMQTVAIELDPQETVIAEAGSMGWMDADIKFEAKMGDGSNPNKGLFGKLLDLVKSYYRRISFRYSFHKLWTGQKEVTFAAPYPGKIVPLDLNEIGGEILCQKDAFLCAALGTSVSVAFTKTWYGFLWWRRFYSSKTKRRWDGISTCRRNNC